MNDISNSTLEFLQHAETKLESAGQTELSREIRQLQTQVDQPCVVAVVGRVKAGKSSFINAILGEDLAKVGVTETTATINRFVYGAPDDPDRPVRCHWRGGRVTNESRGFLDGMQGHDIESLRRAEGILFLEYLLPNELLRDITLVDTPGTCAVVQTHQDRVDDFLTARNRLAEHHATASEAEASGADAVIHLVGPAARTSDRDLLDHFSECVGGHHQALNAIGVLSKTDLYPDLFERRSQLADKIANQLNGRLTTVVPISAAIHRAVSHLRHDDSTLTQFMELTRRIPCVRLRMLLDNESFFMDESFEDCPVTVEERRRLLSCLSQEGAQGIPWQSFARIIEVCANPSLDRQQVLESLAVMAGFEPLIATLRRHFVTRSRLLRCHRVLHDARRCIDRIRFEQLPVLESRATVEEPHLAAMMNMVSAAPGEEALRNELLEVVRRRYDSSRRAAELSGVWEDLELEMSELTQVLADHHAEFEALQEIDSHPSVFSANELAELRPLLGMYGMDIGARLAAVDNDIRLVRDRQLAWRRVAASAKHPARQLVCEQAERSYRRILFESRRQPANTEDKTRAASPA